MAWAILRQLFGRVQTMRTTWEHIGWQATAPATMVLSHGMPKAVVAPLHGTFTRAWHRGDSSWPCAGFLADAVVFSDDPDVRALCRTRDTAPLEDVPGTPRAYRGGDFVYWLGHRERLPDRPDRFLRDGAKAAIVTTLPRYPEGTHQDMVLTGVEESIPRVPVADACPSPSAMPPSSPKTTTGGLSRAI